MHFGENQLAPRSIGISPLTTTHPSIFQHRSVGTSTPYHRSFILVMVRSRGFGSIRRDKRSIQTCFRSGFDCILTKPLPISRQLILQQAHGQLSRVSHCLWAYGFMVYFTPLLRFFSPFPHGTVSLSVTQEYLALRGGPRWFTRDFTCPMLLGY